MLQPWLHHSNPIDSRATVPADPQGTHRTRPGVCCLAVCRSSAVPQVLWG